MKAPCARAWATACVLGGLSLVAPEARAQSPAAQVAAETALSLSELHALTAELGSSDAAVRQRALASLSSLQEDALPALRARLAELRSRGFDAAAALGGMSEFRRVQGVEAPDDAKVDLAQGVLPALGRDRGPGKLLAAELIAYLRALEAQKSPEAASLAVGELFALDSKLFRYEADRTRERLTVLLIPAYIRHRTHLRPWIRRLCEESLLALHIDSPGKAVQQDDVVLLAAILAAYGDTLTFDAMPVVVSYVNDERVAVRAAARGAVRRFGKNAIWQLRERYTNATGSEPNANWGWQRLLDEVARLHDAPPEDAFAKALVQAETALAAGDAGHAESLLDQALVAHPQGDTKRAAAAYARIAAVHFEAGELAPALSGYRRALRLDPATREAQVLRARVLYLEAETRLGQGIADIAAFEQALALDPALTQAQAALDELTGARAEREQLMRRGLGALAALLLLVAGFFVLRQGPKAPVRDESAPEEA
jgi:tetratricopeptide (TPR) repeat protein